MQDKDDSFVEFIRDQLRDLGGVAFRRMFGGYGIYASSRFFAILYEGRLYFKTDAESRAAYCDQGMSPFQPTAKQTLINYYEVPPDVMEDAELLVRWAERAIAAAGMRASRSARTRKKAKKQPE